MQESTDEELLASFRRREESGAGQKCLNELFSRYHSRVATWCYRFTGERESAGDLAQDIFLRAYRNLDSFRGGSKFSTWLYSIARNHCINEMRARTARSEQSAEVLEFEPEAQQEANILSILEKQESLEEMRKLMRQTLDDIERKVMVLHFAQEMKLDTVTRLLGLTNASGARAYLVSAKRKLNIAIQRWNATQRGER